MFRAESQRVTADVRDESMLEQRRHAQSPVTSSQSDKFAKECMKLLLAMVHFATIVLHLYCYPIDVSQTQLLGCRTASSRCCGIRPSVHSAVLYTC